MDTVVWQLIASVAAPGYTIHTIVAIVRELLGEGEVRWAGGGRSRRPSEVSKGLAIDGI